MMMFVNVRKILYGAIFVPLSDVGVGRCCFVWGFPNSHHLLLLQY